MPGATTPERSPQRRRWHVYPATEDLEAHAAGAILRAADQAIAARGAFHVVLAGGTTPQRLYRALAGASADWGRWHVYFGDERCLPVGDPGRNDTMARAAWLDRAPIPRTQLHFIPAELGPDEGAARYATALAEVRAFDLVLLGLGEDGHTASLFPGSNPGASAPSPAALPVRGAPKPPSERVSLSALRLSAARQVLFLVTGSSKTNAVKTWAVGAAMVPAAAIVPPDGVDILIAPDAWPWKMS
jgi:6-phosphogluconolactonase